MAQSKSPDVVISPSGSDVYHIPLGRVTECGVPVDVTREGESRSADDVFGDTTDAESDGLRPCLQCFKHD